MFIRSGWWIAETIRTIRSRFPRPWCCSTGSWAAPRTGTSWRRRSRPSEGASRWTCLRTADLSSPPPRKPMKNRRPGQAASTSIPSPRRSRSSSRSACAHRARRARCSWGTRWARGSRFVRRPVTRHARRRWRQSAARAGSGTNANARCEPTAMTRWRRRSPTAGSARS